MNYKKVIDSYKGRFEALNFSKRASLLMRLFKDLKSHGFKEADFQNYGEDIANLLCEGSTIPNTIQVNWDLYILYMIGRYAEVVSKDTIKQNNSSVKYKKEDQGDLKVDPSEMGEMEWDEDFLKKIDAEDIDE